ncbi:MAG: precorrin-4 C(11)-methyltransferase [Fretibacterium sp.]|nr:precorrin-4 C(11)-methyltransferase [Fretibacterium sp.]
MVHFVGAGPGAPDLITLRAAELLARAGMVVYAGSLVNPALLERVPTGCEIHNSASMTLDEVVEKLAEGVSLGLVTVRLHTGDPSLYGAIREQMDALRERGIPFDVTPGVSSFCAAAAALEAEFTLPGVSQTLILSRMEGRTPVPERESVRSLAAHGASMVFFLSTGLIEELCSELKAGGCAPDTKAALVYKASWPDEQTLRGTLDTLPALAAEAGIRKTALVLVGDFLGDSYELSRLYSPEFSHEYRKGKS